MRAHRSTAIAFLLGAALVGLSSADAIAHQLFLDFDRDDDLWTIEDRTGAYTDTASIILQVSDEDPPEGLRIFGDGSCCFWEYSFPPRLEHYPAVSVVNGEDWCNLAIMTDCGFVLRGGIYNCREIWPMLEATIREGTELIPGQRYLLGKLVLRPEFPVSEYLSCGSGEFGYYFNLWAHELVSNEIWFSNPIPVDEITWGQIKARYR